MDALPPIVSMSVDDVMSRWPHSVRTFLDFRMHCIGCPIAAFHSVSDACREHETDEAAFVRALSVIIARGPSSE